MHQTVRVEGKRESERTKEVGKDRSKGRQKTNKGLRGAEEGKTGRREREEGESAEEEDKNSRRRGGKRRARETRIRWEIINNKGSDARADCPPASGASPPMAVLN